jgi:cyclohexadieny/prephenate dehydrogenase
MLDRFNRDLAMLKDAIEAANGDTLFSQFTRTRTIRRGIVAAGQDSEAQDFFGRPRPALQSPLPYASEA